MPLITPPTDNIYKFMAISGLIILIAALYGINNYMTSDNEAYDKYSAEKMILETEILILKNELTYNKEYQLLNDSLDKFINGRLEIPDIKDSVRLTVFYNLPDSIQSKFKKLFFKKAELDTKQYLINANSPYSNILFWLVYIGIFIGEIIAIIGFKKWYYKTQKLIDDEKISKNVQNILEGNYWIEHCQSCLKTFYHKDELGKEKDGTINKLYCSECYSEGEFIEPELTFKDAWLKLKTNLKKTQQIKWYKWVERIKFKRRLKKTYRWEQQLKW